MIDKHSPSREVDIEPLFIAFEGTTRLAKGPLAIAAVAAKHAHERGATAAILVFDGRTGDVVDLDLRGNNRDVIARLTPLDHVIDSKSSDRDSSEKPVSAFSHLAPTVPTAGRGRPKLGVVAREVTLLPRHWDWLASQPGGASVALRRLVEAACKKVSDQSHRDAAYRFMAAIGGDLPGFEEASRALFAGDPARLKERVSEWPCDVVEEIFRFAGSSH